LQQLRRQLAQAPEPEGVDRGLVEDAAHALRTPLTAIKGYSSSLLQSDLTWTPEVQHEFLKTIDREADRLERVVSDLLAPPGELKAFSRQRSATPPHPEGRGPDG
jgi:signal transduction histidine kinase